MLGVRVHAYSREAKFSKKNVSDWLNPSVKLFVLKEFRQWHTFFGWQRVKIGQC